MSEAATSLKLSTQEHTEGDDHAIAGLLRVQCRLREMAAEVEEFEPADIEQRSLEGRGLWRHPLSAIDSAASELFGLITNLCDGTVTTAPTPPGDDPVEPTAHESPASNKPFICGTMNAKELQEAATAYLYYWIESNGSDDAIALKHHAESLAVEGANAGYAATFQAVMLHSLIGASLDGMITLVAPLIEKYVIPNVDWRKAAIEATERYDAHEKEIQARVWADRQSAKAEPTPTD